MLRAARKGGGFCALVRTNSFLSVPHPRRKKVGGPPGKTAQFLTQGKSLESARDPRLVRQAAHGFSLFAGFFPPGFLLEVGGICAESPPNPLLLMGRHPIFPWEPCRNPSKKERTAAFSLPQVGREVQCFRAFSAANHTLSIRRPPNVSRLAFSTIVAERSRKP